MATNSNNLLTGIVKHIVSGDTIVIRDKPKNRSPNLKTIVLANITAPKLGRRRKDGSEDKDEPYAWEAREFLRKKFIGQEVAFIAKPFPNSTNLMDRELGRVFFPTKDNDIAEGLVSNGLARIQRGKTSGKQAQDPEIKSLIELEEKAKSENKGIWSKDKDKHIRSIKYPSNNEFEKFVADFKRQPVSAIIESVRPSSRSQMMMLDVILLPSFYSIPFAISGIKFPNDSSDYKEEARFFIECRLLQQDNVQVVIEKAMNTSVAGSILHPKGNIAEALLKEGFFCCDDRSITTVYIGAAKLRAAEKFAREKHIRSWRNQDTLITPKEPKNEFQGIVVEISNGDALIVKILNTAERRKIFLSSIRSPREIFNKKEATPEIMTSKDVIRTPKTIYDIPWLFEARELLRKKLIGKRVTVTIDYVQSKNNELPEKMCATVMVGSTNIAEALVASGLATVVQIREKDDRSFHYDELCLAEMKARENQKGLHSKADPPKHRVNDLSGNKAIGLFPMLQKADQIIAIVEYVVSGSRMRLFIPKDSLIITFLLAGISCPRASSRPLNRPSQEGEPFGDEALDFMKDKVLQREVEIHIESHDKKGNMVGTLTINNVNMAFALIQEGLAEVYPSCSDRALLQAEKIAKENKKGIWQHRQEYQKPIMEDDVRKVNYKDIFVTLITTDLHIAAHHLDERKALEELEDKLRRDLSSNPHITYNKGSPPERGKLYAAKFEVDNQWYRGKVEKIHGSTGRVIIHFIDYGNRARVSFEDLTDLPYEFKVAKPFSHEYALACVTMPPEHYVEDVALELMAELTNRKLRLNIEYADHNLDFVSLVNPETNEDCIKTCIEKGLFYVEHRKEKKLYSLIKEYDDAEIKAKKERKLIWEYGDARADDAKEFGLGK